MWTRVDTLIGLPIYTSSLLRTEDCNPVFSTTKVDRTRGNSGGGTLGTRKSLLRRDGTPTVRLSGRCLCVRVPRGSQGRGETHLEGSRPGSVHSLLVYSGRVGP